MKKMSKELINAAKEGDLEKIKELTGQGLDVNVVDKYGGTALMAAARSGNFEIVKYLIEKCGANVDVVSGYRCTALMQAVGAGHLEIVKYLIEEQNADLNVVGEMFGETTLMFAAEKGNTEVGEFLVDCGANINAVDKYNRTALMHAVNHGNLTMVKGLVNCGANVNAVDKGGWTALMHAEDACNDNEQKTEEPDKLSVTAINRHIEIMEYLEGKHNSDARSSFD